MELDTIVCGDCLQVMMDMPDECADVVITSPPYNMGLTPGGNGRGMYRASKNCKASRFYEGYGDYSDAMPIEEYNQWQREVLEQCWRIVRDTGAIYYNHRPRIEHGRLRFPLNLDFGGLPLRQIITWDRLTGIGVNLRHYCSAYEWIFLFAKPGFKLKDHSASGQSDVWNLGMEYGETGHPAPFPLALPVKILETVEIADVVFDPFIGSGTTAVAALKTGRRWYGCDINPVYVDLANQRIEVALLELSQLELAL